VTESRPPEPTPERRPHETLGETFSFNLYRAAERAATILPERAGRRLFTGLGLAYHAADASGRATVARNLSRVLGKPPDSPEVKAAVREAFQSYARYWFDTFLMRVIRPEEFLKRYEMRGLEHVTAALEGGRGALFCTPHLGNWDAGAKWMSLHGYRITAVAEQLRPERLFKLWLEHRRALGLGIVPLSDKNTVAQRLVELIQRNELIALVSDRDLRETGPVVEMFGAERRLPAGPALLSLSTGSPLIPAATYDTEDGWMAVISPPLEIKRTGNMREDVTRLTRLLAAEFERSIAAAPTQWHMWQPAWPEADAAEAERRAGPT
jgi:phosphatidylinositol dimannoside acyltransferase